MNKEQKDWYIKSRRAIENKYFQDSELFINLLSATSPRKSVKANFKLAHKIYLNVISGLEPFYQVKGYLNAHINNVYRAIKNESLSGSKVYAFAEALKGNLNAVVIDTWVLKYFNIKKQSLTPLQYKKMSAKIRDNARKQNLKPAEYQAVIWEIVRSRNGYKPVSFNEVI